MFALTFLLVMIAPVSASAQIDGTNKSLDVLREHDREPVTQLVNEFVQYQSLQQWDFLYDLFSPQFFGRVSRNEWATKRKNLSTEGRMMYIVDFDLKRVLENNPFDGRYSLVGCANVFRDGEIQFTNAHVDVIFEKEAWRVEDYGMFATCLPPQWECKK
jgi:hypothetical protein